MSDFIQIPNKIQKISKQCRFEEALAYGLIRYQIKDDSYLVSISEKELAELGGWSERTSENYIADLEAVGLIALHGKKRSGKVGHPYNVYKLEKQDKEFSIYKPAFFLDPNLTREQKGLLMFLKSYCIPGTRHMPFPSYSSVASTLSNGSKRKIDSDRLHNLIRGLTEQGQAVMINENLVLTNPNILLATDMTDYKNWAYEVIYRFCVAKGVVPPTKNDTESKNLGLIVAQYPNPRTLLTALFRRFKTLPKKVTLSYFAQGLRNMHAKAEPPKPPIIL
jgi:hypothetical protein